MAKTREIPDILGPALPRVDVLGNVLSGKPAAIKPVDIPIADIRRDGATQPRAGLNYEHVDDLVQALNDGATLPAIEVMFDGTAYWLFDGFHRTAAHERLGRTTIAATIHQGEQADAQWESYAANKSHGLKRSNDDKRRQVLAALRHPKAPSLSNREIARHVGVDEGTIRNYRAQMEASAEIPQIVERTVTRAGTTYTQSTGKIGSNQPQRTTLESAVPTVSLDDLEVVDSVTVRIDDDGKPLMDWDDEDWAAYQRKNAQRLADAMPPAPKPPAPEPVRFVPPVAPAATPSDDLDILATDRQEATSAATWRNERIDSILRRLHAAQLAVTEFEELTGIYTHTPTFRRVMDAFVSVLEANRI